MRVRVLRRAAAFGLAAAGVACGRAAGPQSMSPAMPPATSGGGGPADRETPRETPTPAGERRRRPHDVVVDGLDWLARVRNEDGSWGLEPGRAGDPAATGLAVLAFAGGGETHQSGTHKDVVRGGLRWLCERQSAEGSLAPGLREHAIAAVALVEAWGMTQGSFLRKPAQSALDWTRERAFAGDLDLETLGWCLQLWKSAQLPELDVDLRGLARMRDAILASGDSGSAVGEEGLLRASLVLLAIRYVSDEATSDALGPAARALDVAIHDRADDFRASAVLRYFAAHAAFSCDDPVWRAYDASVTVPENARQIVDGPDRGSWEPHGSGIGRHRVPAAALSILPNELHYVYRRVNLRK